LSENDDKDEAMEDTESCNSSKATQKTDNAQVSQSPTSKNEEEYHPSVKENSVKYSESG
jgi:hypothetical protein